MDRLHNRPAGLKPRPTAVRPSSVGRPFRVASWARPALGLLAVGALFLTPGCSKTAQEEGAATDVPTIVADVGKVTRQDLVAQLIVRGTIAAVPNEDVRISALVPGRVTMLHVAEGDAVAAGQVVAEIDPRPLEDQKRQADAAVSQARAALENATLNLDRTDRLFKRGIAAGKEVEDARAQQAAAEAGVETALAALDTATRQLSRAKVTSPIAGRVVKRLVNAGEQVDGTAAQPLIEVANVDVVELAATLEDLDYLTRDGVARHPGGVVQAAEDQLGTQLVAGDDGSLDVLVDAGLHRAHEP